MFFIILSVLIAFIAYIIIQTFIYPKHATLISQLPKQGRQSTAEALESFSFQSGYLERFLKGLRYETVALNETEINFDQIDALIEHIYTSYPNLNKSKYVKRRIVANHSLLYIVRKGDDKGPAQTSFMLIAHLDVVPISSIGEWTYPPFSATRSEDDFIYARGTLDCKAITFGILEALDKLLTDGKSPDANIYIFFGHDEEVGGLAGAKQIAADLYQEGVDLDFILDEGSGIFSDLFPGLDEEIGVIGVSEKVWMGYELSVNLNTSGHGAINTRGNAISILTKALSRLESHSFKSYINDGPELFMLNAIYTHLPFWLKIFIANKVIFFPILSKILDSIPSLASSIKTTFLTAMITGGIKDNVVPATASAQVSLRVHPLDSSANQTNVIRNVINDERVVVKFLRQSAKSIPISPFNTSSKGIVSLLSAIEKVYPSVSTYVPIILPMGTDSKHFTNLTSNIYRFAPMRVKAEEILRIHGVDERISVLNYQNYIRFYYLLLNSYFV